MIASEVIADLQELVDNGYDYEVFYHDADEGDVPVNNLGVYSSIEISHNTHGAPGIVIG